MGVAIASKTDLYMFLEADRVALGREKTIKDYSLNDIWRFQRALRWYEYALNCEREPWMRIYLRLRLRRLSRRLGFTIPPNTFGPGLSIAHYGTIVVSAHARIGSNCRVHVGVNIGVAAAHGDAAPVLGDNCYVGPGAKIFGPVVIGDNTAIGANAVVNQGFPQGKVTIGGVPAHIVSNKGTDGLLLRC